MTIERNILGERAGSVFGTVRFVLTDAELKKAHDEYLKNEVESFVSSCFLGLNDDPTPMDLEEATWTMENWRQDDVEYPEGMTAEMLVDVWNDAVYNYNKTEEDTPMNIYHVTMDSFGSDCPTNWEEIADYLNKLIDDALDGLGEDAEDYEKQTVTDAIWERFCHGGYDFDGCPEPVYDNAVTKRISIDNGRSYCTPSEAIASVSWDAIVAMMDDATCETVHRELAPCSNEEFLTRYLELAPNDLIIG